MSGFELMKGAAFTLSALSEQGFDLDQCHNLVEAKERMRVLGKLQLTPTLSPDLNDFTYTKAFWVFLRREDTDIAGVGVRFEDVGNEHIGRYFERSLSRQYADNRQAVEFVADDLVDDVRGRVVYMGDLFVAPSQRNLSVLRLNNFIRAMQLMVAIEWRFDWLVAFLSRRDVARGAAERYGFSRVVPVPQRWLVNVEGRSNAECFVCTSHAEFLHRVRADLASLDLL